MKLPPDSLTASIESMLYRGSSPLYRDMTAVLHDVLEGDPKALERLTAVIRDHTRANLTVTVHDQVGYGAFIFLPTLDVNHVLTASLAPLQKRAVGTTIAYGHFQEFLQGAEGTLDAHGRVSGVFSKIPAQIIIGKSMFDGSFTPEELAAVFLHEIGHLYSYFRAMGRTVASSIIIQETMEILRQTEDLTERTHAVDTSVKVLRLEGVDAAALAAKGEETAYELVMVRDTVAKLTADQGEVRLFGGEVEMAADSYATRSGAAQPLTSALVKLWKSGHQLQTKSLYAYGVTEAMRIAALTLAAFNPVTLVIASMITGMYVALEAGHALDRSTPVERLEAVHADLVAILKDRRLPAALTEQVLEDVKFVSALRSELTDRLTLVGYLWVTLSPHHRKTYQQQKLQRDIGKLVNNELFSKAAELRTHPAGRR